MNSYVGEIGFKKLLIWQRSHEMVLDLYRLTRSFPRDELHGLTSQIRRAAVSVPANIAEGYARASRKEFVQFLNISYGSLSEIEYYIELIYDLGYIKKEIHDDLRIKRLLIGKMLYKFIVSMKIKKPVSRP